ncbi:MAG: carboxylesterase family protein, partial [Oscillospiraceae bacterium]|nr:carboxylesterase family protein [Oscillospiraceae bacterium]
GLSEYAKKVPVLAGSVQAESVLYAPKFYPYTESAEKRQELLADLYGDKKDELIRLFEEVYPGSDLMDLYNLDYIMRLGTLDFLDAKTEYDAPLYCYLMTYHFGYFGGMPSFHGACLPMAFGNTEYVDAANEPDAVALSQKMHQAWVNFAANGDPNGGDVPEWRPYTKDHRETMIFDRQCGMKEDTDRPLCELVQKTTEPKFRNAFRRS